MNLSTKDMTRIRTAQKVVADWLDNDAENFGYETVADAVWQLHECVSALLAEKGEQTNAND